MFVCALQLCDRTVPVPRPRFNRCASAGVKEFQSAIEKIGPISLSIFVINILNDAFFVGSCLDIFEHQF